MRVKCPVPRTEHIDLVRSQMIVRGMLFTFNILKNISIGWIFKSVNTLLGVNVETIISGNRPNSEQFSV